MKTLILALPFLVLAGSAIAGDCQRLDDPDARHYCRAVNEGRSSECGSISGRNLDLKRRCLAEVRGDGRECASILDPQRRYACNASLGR